MKTIRLTMAQALMRYIIAQEMYVDGDTMPLIPAVWAIFGHGNVAGLGEALYQYQDDIPTYRAHNEQAMTLAAVAFAKQRKRRQLMACTTSIGPGATNMLTAAALAHVNRLPVLLLPGDVFASRAPDPVLQQLEDFSDPNITVNDCFKPVSRYWDRICRPEQLLTSLPRAIQVLTDPVDCGPVTLCLPQDVQAMAWDFPESFFHAKTHCLRRPGPDLYELANATEFLRNSKRPLIIAGGGVHYSDASAELLAFADRHGIPVAETQAGKGSVAWDHPMAVGAIGVTGSSSANEMAAEADLIVAIGTRLQDFTTASRSLFEKPGSTMLSINVCPCDSIKHKSQSLICDAKRGLEALGDQLADWHSIPEWIASARDKNEVWNGVVDFATASTDAVLPGDAQVIGAVNRHAGPDGIVVCAAGGLPGDLHNLWRSNGNGDYHLEYGYSCMGYEIAGGLGVKIAEPDRDVYVMVGDGSYLMMNSEIATSLMLGHKLTIVVLNNRGFACINRLQKEVGSAPFNNLLRDAISTESGPPEIDFAAHAQSLGAETFRVASIEELETALQDSRSITQTVAIVIETDPDSTVEAGGAWWDVAVPEETERQQVRIAHSAYVEAKKNQDQ